nr:unnamed protein product [Callosobruchus chinensis]
MLNQNAKRVAVKVLVKDDMPLFLHQKSPIYQKNFYAEQPKSDFFVYDQLNKSIAQKYPKTIQESMLSFCQQYSNSMQLFPYFNYYHPSLVGGLSHPSQEEIDVESRDSPEQN